MRQLSLVLLLCLFGVNLCHAATGECLEFDVTSNRAGLCGFSAPDCLLPVPDSTTCGPPLPKPQSALTTRGEGECRSTLRNCVNESRSCLQDNGACLARGLEVTLATALEQPALDCLKKLGYTFVGFLVTPKALPAQIKQALTNANAVFGTGKVVIIYQLSASSAWQQMVNLRKVVQSDLNQQPARTFIAFDSPTGDPTSNQVKIVDLTAGAKAKSLDLPFPDQPLPIGFLTRRDVWGDKVNKHWTEQDPPQYLWMVEAGSAIPYDENYYGFHWSIKEWKSAYTSQCKYNGAPIAFDELVMKEI